MHREHRRQPCRADATRLPPHQYVIARRVERAKQLLQTGGDFSLATMADADQRVMMGVQGKAQPMRRTTNSRHDVPRPNPVDCPRTTRAAQVWIVDLTCVGLQDERAYPAVLMDVFTRRNLGWDLGRSPDQSLA
jgi:transposase InsO family protein